MESNLLSDVSKNLFKDFDMSSLTFEPLDAVSTYFAGIKRIVEEERRGIRNPMKRLTWEEFCLELFSSDDAKTHFNNHNFKLFIRFLVEYDNKYENFNYFSEPIFEMDLIHDILLCLFTEPAFDIEPFRKLTTFEEVLICYEIIATILDAIFNDIAENNSKESK